MKSTLTLDSDQIEQVWVALTGPTGLQRPLSQRRSENMAEAGWVYSHEIDDALCDMDSRMGMTWLARLSDQPEKIGLETQPNYPRVWQYPDEISGSCSLSASDVLRLFWWIERLGFPIDTGGFCKEITKFLPRTNNLSESHIDVLLYPNERYSQPPIELTTQDFGDDSVIRTDNFTSENGIFIEVSYDQNDRIISLISTASAYIAPRAKVSVTCVECGCSYVQGLKSEEDEHAIRHNKIMETLNPSPSLAWRDAVEADPELVWVNDQSPKWMHVALQQRAHAFKREFNYDFIQWSDSPGANHGGTAYAFLDDDYRLIGACGFRLKGGVNQQNRLDWIWLCPKHRRNGHLTKNWLRLRKKMGNFDLEPPVSEAMQQFIKDIDKNLQIKLDD